MGMLTGKFKRDTTFPKDDVRSVMHMFGDDGIHIFFDDKGPKEELLDKLEDIREILKSNGRSLVQGAIAWIWGKSGKTIPIPGFKTAKQVEENARAMEFGPLTKEQMKEIDSILN
jgi:aryl-alcohol dehydrogenase-like predicted oxidoreductase